MSKLDAALTTLRFSVDAYQLFDTHGILFGILVVCVTALAVLATADADEDISPKYVLAALLPWLFSAAFVANGALDHSQEMRYHTVVIEEHFNQPRWWVGDNIVVRSQPPADATSGLAEAKKASTYVESMRFTIPEKV